MFFGEKPSPIIFDIRNDKHDLTLGEMTRSSIRKANGRLELPSLLLWDKEGLQLFERITYHPDYYLTGDEIEILQKHSEQIAERIEQGAIVLELGSGNLRKVSILLNALERAKKNVSYYALDVSQEELYRTLSMIAPDSFEHVKCFGLLGTYDDGFAWAQLPEHVNHPKIVLSLGSTIGSSNHVEAANFLRSLAWSLTSGDGEAGTGASPPKFLIGLDGTTDGDKVWQAYNDPEGYNRSFILNGLKHANGVLGYEAFAEDNWEIEGQWDEDEGAHIQYAVPRDDCVIEGVLFRRGQRVQVIQSTKFNAAQEKELWRAAGFKKLASWSKNNEYGLHLLTSIY